MGWGTAQIPNLAGRHALVTGANSGIGYHTARELAVHGAHVLLACRDTERGERAARQIAASPSDTSVEVVELDLSSMASISDFAASLVQRDEPLDLLVNNAGVMAPPHRELTVDGFERQFGINHLGHFVLTALLLPALRRSDAARVVTVSSVAHFGAGRDVLDANMADGYHPSHAYSNSKLANLLFARELQRRAADQQVAVVSTAAHPGFASTGLVGNPDGMGASRVVRLFGPAVIKAIGQSAAAGALPTLYAATVAAPGSYTGPQHLRESRGPIGPAKLSSLAQDEQLARRLWGISEELTGLRYSWPARN